MFTKSGIFFKYNATVLKVMYCTVAFLNKKSHTFEEIIGSLY